MNDSQSVPRRGSEERRQQLLDVSRDLFVRDGYSGTPISAIVAAAGVAQGTFYVYFKSKQAVLAELRRQAFKRYAQALHEAAALPLPADARLVQIVLAMVRVVRDQLPLERVFREADSADALARAAIEGRARLAREAAQLLRAGQDQGALISEAPEVTAHLIVALFDTVLFEVMAYDAPAPTAAVVDQALRFTLRGLGVPDARIRALVDAIDRSEVAP